MAIWIEKRALDVMAEESCQFYRIARKEAPASYIYEDERAIAFLDMRPLNDGHTLVIPKEQHETIFDVSGEEVAHLFEIVKKVAVAVKRDVGAEGITISQHNGRAAGQDVFHLRLHVIPRYEGQKLRRFEEIPEAGREKLDEVANRKRKCGCNHSD